MPDEGLRFEAWSMPHVGALTRKFDFTKLVESWTLNDRFNDLTDGTMTIPDDASLATGVLLKDRLFYIDEANHTLDVGSMIRVCRGATPIMHYLITRFEDSFSDGEPTCKFALEGLEWILDRVLVPNYDHPADPSVEPDWIYGAPSILANTDFENAGATNILVHVWIESTVTAGTWTITFPAQTTSALAWNIDITALQTAIEGLSNIQDIIISGAGTAANPWVIEVVDPAGTDFNVSVNSAGLTGGAALMLSMVQGGAGIVDPWTHSFNPLTRLEHGTYTNFQTSTLQAHTGTTSLYVKGAIGPWAESFPGAQQVITVTGGRTYRAKIWVYPKFAASYRFVIRSTDETWIGSVEAALTANSWQEMAFSVTIPDHISSIIFRIACISTGAVHEFFIDDALLAPGQDAATLGKMVDDVRTAAIAVGSPLSWLTPTWSTTLDSDGVAWDSTRMWNVNHGQSFLQLFEYARKWNYEFRIRWDVADNRFEWDMWNPLAGGQVRANIAITGKSGVEGSAPIVKRPPGATYVKTEGSQVKGGLPWGEFASTTLDDVWGRLEKFHQDRQGVDSTELDELAERIITKSGDNTAARSITVADPTLLPWTAYEPGDIVTLNLAPKDVKRELRVAAIVASKGPNDAVPRYDVHFGAVVYSNDTAIASGLRTLIREFRRPTPTSLDGTPVTPAAGGGGAPTVVVAAANSSQMSKDRADFICTGVNDHLLIQQILDGLALLNVGCRMLLCEGLFSFNMLGATTHALRLKKTTTLLGMGQFATIINLTSGNPAAANLAVISTFGQHGAIHDLAMSAVTIATNPPHLIRTTHAISLERLFLEDAPQDAISCGSGTNPAKLHHVWVVTPGRDGLSLSAQNVEASGVKIQQAGRHNYYSDSGGGTLHDCVSEGAAENGFNLLGWNGKLSAIRSEGDTLDGIYAEGCEEYQFVDSRVLSCGRHGIHLNDSSNGQVHDNIVSDASEETDNTYDCIALEGDSDGNSVQSNRVFAGGNVPRYGINVIDTTCNNNVIDGNVAGPVGDFGTGAYNDGGTGTQGANFTV